METTEKMSTNKYLQSLAVGLLGTATAFGIAGTPQEAQAIVFGYGYSYQQITDLTIGGLTGVTFESLTGAGATIQPNGNPNAGSASDEDVFDVLEQYAGAGTGIGNNTGFFSNTAQIPPTLPPYSSAKGQVSADYARGDAQFPGVMTSADVTNALFGSGLSFASVTESYLDNPQGLPTNPALQANYRVDQGNAVSSGTLGSSIFQLDDLTGGSIDFEWGFRNESFTELGENTPAGYTDPGNQIRAGYDFRITLNEVTFGPGGEEILTQVEQIVNALNNFNNVRNVAGSSTQVASSTLFGSQSDGFDSSLLNPDTDYKITIGYGTNVDTRIVGELPEQPQEVPEPTSVVTLLGLGSLGLILKRKNQQV